MGAGEWKAVRIICSPELECIVDMSMFMSRAHCLRPMEMAKPPPRPHTSVLNNWLVCIETINHSFLLSDDCNLKLIPHSDLLPRLAIRASLSGYKQQTHLLDPEVRTKRDKFPTVACVSPPEQMDHQIPAFL